MVFINMIEVDNSHYKKCKIQPWDFIHQNNIGFFEGSAIGYIVRWKDKGGVVDLQKAINILEKLIINTLENKDV